MIPRRVYEHVKAHNWFAVAIDLAVVVTGLLIGFQIDRAWEAQRTKSEIAEYRQRLVDDFRSELDAIGVRIAYFSNIEARGLSALAAYDLPAEELGARFIVDAYQATQIWPFSAPRGAYDEMISAGRINLIPDTDLRKRLATYYSELEQDDATWNEEKPYRELVRSHLPVSIQFKTHEACERNDVDAGGAVALTQPAECVVPLSPAEIAEGVAALKAAPMFKVELNRQISSIENKLRLFRVRAEQVKAMIDYVEREG
jgi:hypothetical protein